jgi:hypothetical protein
MFIDVFDVDDECLLDDIGLSGKTNPNFMAFVVFVIETRLIGSLEDKRETRWMRMGKNKSSMIVNDLRQSEEQF